MPACGSEGACLQGLWSSKAGGLASPRCPGSPPPLHLVPGRERSAGQQQQQQQQQQPRRPIAARALSYARRLLAKVLTYCLLAPAVWLSAWLYLFWLCLQLPLVAAKFLLRFFRTGSVEPAAPLRKRCVLISGGSTVQAVQLARNLGRAGARVVVCDLEGAFGLTRFSTACARYYSLPRPSAAAAAEYVSALRDIVLKEKVSSYVPVSPAPGSAYYDALAKPHLELLGCECFVPGAAEVALLDDPLELIRRARLLGLPTPSHRIFASLEDAAGLYENGSLRAMHYALLAGPAGMRERSPDLRLPPTLVEFTRSQRAQQQQQLLQPGQAWLVVKDPGGAHFLTCTTVRDSKLLANVTCRLDEHKGALVPEDRPEVSRWLERFFSRGWPRGKISGHLSFRLAAWADKPEEVVALSCRVGLGLGYLGQASLHARLLWRPCRHRFRPGSPRELFDCRHLREENAFGRPLNKKEALFRYWDPLPYCVYCYLQLPWRRMVEMLGAQQPHHKPPLAVVQ